MVADGEDCTQVYAAADEGYCFIGWSDGLTSAQRLDENITDNKTFTARFEKIAYVTITYLADEGGTVYGNLIQTVESGKDCTQVYAVAEEGYCFIGWSDGVDTAQRLDTEVIESKTVTAEFEEISILFF